MRGRFLTQRDRTLIRGGPELKQKTKREYRGDRIEGERRAHRQTYARVLREAQRDARGALEDLYFLARTLDARWLAETFGETRPLETPTARAFRRAVGDAAPTFTYLELFLQALAGRIAWERVPFRAKTPNVEVATEYPEFFIERWATALQVGVNSLPGLRREVDVRLRPPTALLDEWKALGVDEPEGKGK